MGGVMIGSTGYNRVWAIIGLGHILFPHLGRPLGGPVSLGVDSRVLEESWKPVLSLLSTVLTLVTG